MKSRPSPQPVSNNFRRMTKAEHLTSVQSRDIIPQNVQDNLQNPSLYQEAGTCQAETV